MALFHLSVTQTKRSAGQSAIASAAYRAGERLYSEYYGEYSDYTRKGGVICSDILLPSHAPPEYADRQTLWNAVEKAERGKNAQLAYSFDIALQNEFSLEENIALARQFLLENFVSRGMVVDFAVHQPDREDGGIPNPHFHVLCPKKDRSVQYSYRCGGYASKVNSCSAHSISADNVEALILSAVKRLSRFVLNDEEAFAKELQALWNEKQTEKPKHNKSELHRFQKRYDELSKLIRGLYENLVSGLLPERQYKQLMKQYDDEQAELETKIEEMEKELTEEKVNAVDIKHFISLIRKCKEPTEISDLMFAELIDKIVVYEAEGVGKARTQKVDIYFNYVGQVDIAYTEEELAEIKAQEEQIEMERLAKQREREIAYREKRKAKKLAETGGEIVKTKICPHCQKEFVPTSNRQISRTENADRRSSILEDHFCQEI